MQIGILGSFDVRADDGARVEVPGARLRGVLVALALRPGQVVARDALVDWVWASHPPADASNALHRLVSRLRKVLPEGVLEGHSDGYRLKVQAEAVDAVRFEQMVGEARSSAGPARAQTLGEALELWRGSALQDIGLSDSEALNGVVARLEELRLGVTEDWADAEAEAGRAAATAARLTDLAAVHPLRERLAAATMRALAEAGRSAEALRVFQRTREVLAEELGADPSGPLAALHLALLRAEHGRTAGVRASNLRAELTSFVGRAEDVAVVCELVAGNRLVTVLGPGGSGKTRLATETARILAEERAEQLPDGVRLVELAGLDPQGDVAQAAFAALGQRDALLGAAPSADLTARLVAAVQDRRMLLILDNCEHVIESAAVFAHRVLGECPGLRVLATSREPLGITGEALWQLNPLDLPAADADPVMIESAPAVQLLRDRAQVVRAGLGKDAATSATLARVVRALDGMPLAIELAAARLRSMSLDQLAARLDDRFRLLTGGSRTALPRHRTLRAVIDWSWQLLTDDERRVLRRLSVFSGGVSLEAAEAVCVSGLEGPDGRDPGDLLEVLTALTEKSLLVAEGDSTPRYRMLGTIREYAGSRLVEAGEQGRAVRDHLNYFIGLAEAAEPHLRRREQLVWLARLAAEHDNIGSAMRGALAAGQAQEAMRLGAAAGWYWWLGGHKAEGSELIGRAARLPGDVAEETRAMVYALVVLFLNSGRGDEREAAEWIRRAHRVSLHSQNPILGLVAPLERMLRAPESALESFASLLDSTDPWVRALARLQLGKMRIVLGGAGREADAHLELALTEFRSLGERFGISFALSELADRIAGRGELGLAGEYYEQAVAVVTEIGADEDVIRMRARQAQLYWLMGRKQASEAALAEARRRARRVTWSEALIDLALAQAELARWSGDPIEARRQLGIAATMLEGDNPRPDVEAVTHDVLGYFAEDLEQARRHREQACQAAARLGYAPLVARVLVGVADLALRRDQDEQAARLLAAGAAVLGLLDCSHPDVARIQAETRDRLGESRFAEAGREGADADWTQLVRVTLAS